MKLKWIAVAAVGFLLLGCSAQQSQTMGLRSSAVNKYPQQMSNMELCETYAYGRATNQTRVAIGAEWNRRKINHKYCKEIREEYYLTTLSKQLLGVSTTKKAKKVDAEAKPLPAVPLNH